VVRVVIACKEILQRNDVRIAGIADDDRTGPCFHQSRSAKDEGTHDALAELGFTDYQLTQLTRSEQQGLHVFYRARVDHCRLAGQLAHLCDELPWPQDQFIERATQPVAVDNPDGSFQDDEHARACLSCFKQEFTGRVLPGYAKAPGSLDLPGRQLRVHVAPRVLVMMQRRMPDPLFDAIRSVTLQCQVEIVFHDGTVQKWC